MSLRSRIPQWGLVVVLVVAVNHGYPFRAKGVAKDDRAHAHGLEERDESSAINVLIYPRAIAHGGNFVILGQVFRLGDDAAKDRQAAIKTCEDAIPVLEAQLRKGFPEQDHRKVAERSLEVVKKQLKATQAHRPSEFRWVHVRVVPGADRPPHAQYSTLFQTTSSLVEISIPPTGLGNYQVNLSANMKPGPYTVILTPLDPTSVNGAVLAGGSDTITITVAEPPAG